MKHKYNQWLISGLLLVLITSAACQPITAAPSNPTTVYGESGDMGEGTARTFAELNPDGSPVRIGIVFDQGAMEGLPTEPNLESRCFDANGNGANEAGECIGDYDLVLSLPPEVTQNGDIPIQWAAMAWNPHGHQPPIWSVPHFDFHFYLVSQEEVEAIRPGPCVEKINCEDRERAMKPVPAPYLPANYVDVGATVMAMGNHLIDPTAPELADLPQAEFTHSFIYGAYDGHITFYEPMIAHDYLVRKPNECQALSLPKAWETSGYYPTQYCIGYALEQEQYSVVLEEFVYRKGKQE